APALARVKVRILARTAPDLAPGHPRARRNGTAPRRTGFAFGGGGLRARLAQAAVLVLLLAGGAAALLPGPPVRRPLGGVDAGTGPLAPDAPAIAAQESEMGVRADPAAGRLRVALDLPPGTPLSVSFVDGERAGVFAAPGARFRSADGELEAAVSEGPVR